MGTGGCIWGAVTGLEEVVASRKEGCVPREVGETAGIGAAGGDLR